MGSIKRNYLILIAFCTLLFIFLGGKILFFHYTHYIGQGEVHRYESIRFSPNGKFIAYPEGHNSQIKIITINGDYVTDVVGTESIRALRWLSDEEIVYESYTGNPSDDYIEYRLTNINGKINTSVSEKFRCYSCSEFDLSPSGQKIAFIDNPETGPQINILNIDTQHIEHISSPLDEDWNCKSLSWSPNNNYLLYTCEEWDFDLKYNRSQMWLADTILGQTFPVSEIDESEGWNNPKTLKYGFVSWSPDGNWIVYQGEEACRLLSRFLGCSTLRLAPVSDNKPVFWRSYRLRTGTRFAGYANWNPSNDELVYAGVNTMKDYESQIMIMNLLKTN